MKIKPRSKIVKKYLVEYMFGEINRNLEWFDDEEEMNDVVSWLKSKGEELTYCKKYEVKEIKD